MFRYGSMGAAKSLNLITTNYNYRELGLSTVVVVPNNSHNCVVLSRVGLSTKAIKIGQLKQFLEHHKVDCILVDEAQFLTKNEVLMLNDATLKDITVICYGLRTAANGELFDGSATLLSIADEIEELPTLCPCGRKARMNLRLIDNKVDKSNEMIVLKEESRVAYVSVCRECYYKFKNGDNAEELNKYDNTSKCKEENKHDKDL